MTTAVLQPRKRLFRSFTILLAVALLFLVIALGVSLGELSIPLQSVFYAISNKIGLTEMPLSRIHESVIWDFRLSRALVAACSGAGLAICGAVLQSLLKMRWPSLMCSAFLPEHRRERFPSWLWA